VNESSAARVKILPTRPTVAPTPNLSIFPSPDAADDHVFGVEVHHFLDSPGDGRHSTVLGTMTATERSSVGPVWWRVRRRTPKVDVRLKVLWMASMMMLISRLQIREDREV
jgi:hypothetical protein